MSLKLFIATNGEECLTVCPYFNTTQMGSPFCALFLKFLMNDRGLLRVIRDDACKYAGELGVEIENMTKEDL